MKGIARHRGRVVPLERSFVDTDQIIPAEYTKRTEKTGFGDALFAHWRQDPDFVLNDPRYQGATILLGGPGFGVGSSREHAVWALRDYGFVAVVSQEFGDIFKSNCNRGGLLALEVGPETMAQLWRLAREHPRMSLKIDVATARLTGPELDAGFLMDRYTRTKFIEGQDDISMALRYESAIAAHEATRPDWLPNVL